MKHRLPRPLFARPSRAASSPRAPSPRGPASREQGSAERGLLGIRAGARLGRRAMFTALALAGGLASFGVTRPARADEEGTYLRTAAILLDESKRSTDWLLTHEGDVELARVLHDLAEARVKAGRQVLVPKEVDRAHPHLLLTLETVERAFDASTQGDWKRTLKLVLQAREEEQNYRTQITQLGHHLPDVDRVERVDRPCPDASKRPSR